MRVEGVYLNGIGTCTPSFVDTATAVENGWNGAAQREESGLVSIAVAGQTPAPQLAVNAARIALDQAGEVAGGIGALFHSHVHPQGPDGWAVQHYINRHTVDRPITAACINNGCLGVFNSLAFGSALIRQGAEFPSILITSADNLGTPMVDRWNSSYFYVLADAGGAVVLSSQPGFATLRSVAAVSDPALEVLHRGDEPLFPPGVTVGKKTNFNERLAYCRRRVLDGEMNLPDFGSVAVEAMGRALEEARVSIEDIARVVHVGFAHEPLHDLFLDPLDIDDARGCWEFTRTLGHAGPTDQIAGLAWLWRSGKVSPGDHVALLGGAPGMEAACAIVRIEQPAS